MVSAPFCTIVLNVSVCDENRKWRYRYELHCHVLSNCCCPIVFVEHKVVSALGDVEMGELRHCDDGEEAEKRAAAIAKVVVASLRWAVLTEEQ